MRRCHGDVERREGGVDGKQKTWISLTVKRLNVQILRRISLKMTSSSPQQVTHSLLLLFLGTFPGKRKFEKTSMKRLQKDLNQ